MYDALAHKGKDIVRTFEGCLRTSNEEGQGAGVCTGNTYPPTSGRSRNAFPGHTTRHWGIHHQCASADDVSSHILSDHDV